MGGSGYHVGARLRRTTRGARMVKLARVLLPVLIGLWSVPASALFTGLVQIPTARVLDPNTYNVQFEFDGPLSETAVDTNLLETQFSLNPRLEAGIDLDMNGTSKSRFLGNLKYVICTAEQGRCALALGGFTLTSQLDDVPYVIATRDFGGFTLHVGGAELDEAHPWWLLGADSGISNKVVWMADYISGEGNYSSVGVQYNFSNRFNVQWAVLFPNSSGFGTRFSLQITIIGPS